MVEHFTQYKHILMKYNNINEQDLSNVPIQVSFDASATTGRFYTRKVQRDDFENRVIYGLTTSCPSQKTLITVNERDDGKHISKSQGCITIHGMEHTLDLVEKRKIIRAKSYMSIVVLALLPKARPYCLGMYAVGKGTDTASLEEAHRLVLQAGSKSGLRIVTLPGDGDTTLRSSQWTKYDCKRYQWLTQLYIPLDLFYDSNGTNPVYSQSKTFSTSLLETWVLQYNFNICSTRLQI